MPYTPGLSPGTARSIRAYVKGAESETRAELAQPIRTEIERFANLPVPERQNWGLGVPVHRVRLRTSDGVGRYLQFTYRYAEAEDEIWITSFGLVPMQERSGSIGAPFHVGPAERPDPLFARVSGRRVTRGPIRGPINYLFARRTPCRPGSR